MNRDKRRLSQLFLTILFVTIGICAVKANASAGSVTGYQKITWGISTGRYYVNGVHAFCAQYNKSWPTVGTVVDEIVPCTNDVLRKALYYGYNGPQNTLGTDERAHVLTAIAVSDANIGESATGASAKYDAFYWELVNNPSKYPSPPSNFKVYLAITASDAMQNLAFYEMEKNGYVSGIKKSSNSQLDTGNPCYSLAGAQYGIYSDAGLQESSRVGTLSTDANGEMNTVELPTGTYYAYETVSPKGYAKSNEVTTFTVEAEKTARLEFKDAPQVNPIDILIQKVDSETNRNAPQGNAKLEGAEFTVCYYAGIWQSDEDPSTFGETPKRTWVFQTDEHGVVRYHASYQVSGDELYEAMPLGTLVIKETKASEGYLLNGDVVVRKIYSEGDAEHMAVYNSPIISEKVIEVKLTKYQSDTNIAIPGVSFVHMAPDGTRTGLITDQNGQLILKGLQYGKHTIWESTTVDGYAINGYIHSFTIDKDTDKNIEIVAYNDPTPYQVVLHKTDHYGNKLANAEFTLYEDEECLIEIQRGTTDENGVLHLYGLEAWKKYYLKETKAPPGYTVQNDEAKSVHVYEIHALSVPVRGEFICYVDGAEYSNVSGTKANREVNIEITNDVGYVLPKTGSPATLLTNLVGVAMCGMSLCLNRRKTKKGEKIL